ncbi:hypothetical protein GCM10010530_00840 [Kribbella aluminosa]
MGGALDVAAVPLVRLADVEYERLRQQRVVELAHHDRRNLLVPEHAPSMSDQRSAETHNRFRKAVAARTG